MNDILLESFKSNSIKDKIAMNIVGGGEFSYTGDNCDGTTTHEEQWSYQGVWYHDTCSDVQGEY